MTALSARPAVRTAATTDYTCALVDGPWQHEFVSSGGSRFHVVVAGPEHRSAPLVVLLHGYPQFWWAWRAQIPALADAGYRVAAMDVRGAGGSDKPPSGYGVPARAADVAGVVRSLGRERAVVVGHGTGGTLAWAVAALHPGTTSAVAVLSSPHPARVRLGGRAAFTPAALRELAYLQMPTLPERALTQGDLVARTLALGAAARSRTTRWSSTAAPCASRSRHTRPRRRCGGPCGPRRGWTAAGSGPPSAVRSTCPRCSSRADGTASSAQIAPTSTPSSSRGT
nr:hypothetical protein GCM10025730_36200 [Promicromonospora thailandica]